jgi:hypothetical protein
MSKTDNVVKDRINSSLKYIILISFFESVNISFKYNIPDVISIKENFSANSSHNFSIKLTKNLRTHKIGVDT